MIKVLIVDDSEVYRVFLHNILGSEYDIEIVSMARNGKVALPRVSHYKPDVVLLDYEMPEMDGLSAIPEIKRLSPATRIIMFSSHTKQGARLTIKALNEGADDFITKPTTSLEGGVIEELRRQVLERIRALARQEGLPTAQGPLPVSTPTPPGRNALRYCAIGISTGGPPALRRLFRQIPRTIQGSIFVAQHMPPLFTAQLAESLRDDSELDIREASDGLKPAPATAYIAPGGLQMRVVAGTNGPVITVEPGNPKELCKPSVNILFNSLALSYPQKTLAVIMTGMGEDGYLGMRQLSVAGAYLMAQKPEDCVIFGMPAKPIQTSIVHEIHDVDGLAERISEFLQ